MWPSLGLLLHRIKVAPLHARGILVRVLIIGINIISTIVIAIIAIAIPCVIITVFVIISIVIILNNTLSSSQRSLKNNLT